MLDGVNATCGSGLVRSFSGLWDAVWLRTHPLPQVVLTPSNNLFLVQRKLREVLTCAAQWWLRFLEQQMIAHHQRVNVRKHETAVSIIR